MQENIIFSVIFIALYTIPVIVIAILQIRYIQSQNKVAILSPKDFGIAKKYAITMQNFNIIESLFNATLFVFWLNFGLQFLSAFFEDNFIPKVLFVVVFLAINSIISLPLEAYKTLVIDKAFGFTKSNGKLFLFDCLKSFALLLVIGFMLSAGLIYLIDNIKFWWIYGFGFIFIIALLANIIYPTIIAPLFNKFTPLDNESLKSAITMLMDKVGFRANGIFVMDASKRDGRLNAYFGGLGKNKRVVLFDTLLSKVTHDELLAILGHELAHFKHKDLIKNLVIMAFVLFLLFFIASHLPSFGNIPQNAATTLCVLILIQSLIAFYCMPIINFFSRKAEYKADKFGSELTNKQDLSNALKKLINENKAFPYSHAIYTFFYMSHPPLLDRLKALDCNDFTNIELNAESTSAESLNDNGEFHRIVSRTESHKIKSSQDANNAES